jgi:predicted RecB family nuclease
VHGTPHLSKTRFTSGLQCHRLLWWTVNEPTAPELETSAELEAVFDQGARVGELARTYIPGGELIDLPYSDMEGRVDATRAAIAAGERVIYEAAFRANGVFVSVDILHRTPRATGWTLTEVKSTTKVKTAHIPDAAVQTHVLRRVGLPVVRTELMHLNRACRHPDLSNLFTRADVSEEVATFLPEVPGEVNAQLTMLGRSTPPAVTTGRHCTSPYECPFLARCHGVEPSAPLDGEVVIRPGLRDALAELQAPVAHLDFETINPAIPVWPGCRPYDQIPVQFSVHVEPARRGGETRHFEWLAERADDPRPALARALVRALRGAGSIVVYSQPFEEGRLRELQEAVPDLAEELQSIIDRLFDLLPVMRAHVRHPGFEGHFSLKNVAPALVPHLRYDEMEIGDGGTASRTLEAMLLGPRLKAAENQRTRRALLSYCQQDTRATMGVLAWLREVA